MIIKKLDDLIAFVESAKAKLDQKREGMKWYNPTRAVIRLGEGVINLDAVKQTVNELKMKLSGYGNNPAQALTWYDLQELYEKLVNFSWGLGTFNLLNFGVGGNTVGYFFINKPIKNMGFDIIIPK